MLHLRLLREIQHIVQTGVLVPAIPRLIAMARLVIHKSALVQ